MTNDQITKSTNNQIHRQRLASLLEDKSLCLLFSNDKMPRNGDQYFPFRQNSNFYYMSGIDYPDSILAICPQHPNPKFREILFIEQKTEKEIIRNGCAYTQASIRENLGIQTVLWSSDFETILQELMYHTHIVYIDIEEHIKFNSDVKSRGFRYANSIKLAYPLHNYRPVFQLIADMRLVKSAYEIEQIKKSCEITAKAFERAIQFVKPNVREYEIAAEITYEINKNGAVCAFSPIVAAGKNACTLHYVDNRSLCKDGGLVLLDFGAEYANYASDLSRTIPVNGRFTTRQKQAYNACFRVYEYAKVLFVPGMSINKVQKKVSAVMQQELLNLGLFSHSDLEKQSSEYELMKKYFMHGISHFIGLDVHDVGTKDTVFEEGMVLTCEPGIYIPEEEIGIRIETMMLVSRTPVDLMKEIPASL
jgi:Xaa-Pro aminopeptidase